LNPLPIAVQALLALIVIPAAVFDLRCRRVPNWLTLSGLILAFGLNAFLYHTAGLAISLQGTGLALLVYLLLYLLRATGGGDVKLMAAIGAAAGPLNWLGIFVLTSLLGGIAALTLIAARGRVLKTFANIGHVVSSLASGKAPYAGNPELDVQRTQGARMPHAVIIACGTLGFLLIQAAGIAISQSG
jgi:prepilin peptidase CpaA